MCAIRRFHRRLTLKELRRPSFCIQFVIVFIICAFLLDLIVTNVQYLRQKGVTGVTVQNDLLNYNEDGLRPQWNFRINKHYNVSELRTYKSKPKILARFDLPGENGAPVILSPALQKLAKSTFKEYEINIVASDKVSHNRSLPDFRDSKCLNIKYPNLLPSTSVIMVIHNEAWSILMRAIRSVLNRSPDELLEELILVDDFSDKPHLLDELDEYLATQLPTKVKLIRTEKREGLIRARVIGAESAKGQVLAFLDGNTESNDGWLEPLLSRIASDRSVIAVPHVDNINFTNMAYEHFDEGMMYGLGWNLYYKTFPIPEREIVRNHGDMTAPYRTPALIGCAIVIDREFFFEIGTFDTDMNIWGGENTELSLRTWQCGGAIEIVPCSRMGHYFRILPYSFGNESDKEAVKTRNNMRIAEVWLDEYKPYFDLVTDPGYKHMNGGDVSKRLALREQLKCKGFTWFLKNVFPESEHLIVGYRKIGQIQAVGTKYCVDRLGPKENVQIGIRECHGNGYGQGFVYLKNQQIIFPWSACLSLAKNPNSTDSNIPQTNTSNHVVLLNCNSTNGTKWDYDEKKNQIKHLDTGSCLSTEAKMMTVAPCNPNDSNQHWIITSFLEYKRKIIQNSKRIFQLKDVDQLKKTKTS